MDLNTKVTELDTALENLKTGKLAFLQAEKFTEASRVKNKMTLLNEEREKMQKMIHHLKLN